MHDIFTDLLGSLWNPIQGVQSLPNSGWDKLQQLCGPKGIEQIWKMDEWIHYKVPKQVREISDGSAPF